MCGRYRLSKRKQLIAEYFDIDDDVDWEPRYNIGLLRLSVSFAKIRRISAAVSLWLAGV
jgi:putative SOS response-associated peptidase YedK